MVVTARTNSRVFVPAHHFVHFAFEFVTLAVGYHCSKWNHSNESTDNWDNHIHHIRRQRTCNSKGRTGFGYHIAGHFWDHILSRIDWQILPSEIQVGFSWLKVPFGVHCKIPAPSKSYPSLHEYVTWSPQLKGPTALSLNPFSVSPGSSHVRAGKDKLSVIYLSENFQICW